VNSPPAPTMTADTGPRRAECVPPRRPPHAHRRGFRSAATVLTAILAAALAYLVLFPIARLVLLALADGGANLARALGTPALGRTLLTTVVLALVSVMMAAVLGTVLAWLAMRLPVRHRWAAVLPGMAGATPSSC